MEETVERAGGEPLTRSAPAHHRPSTNSHRRNRRQHGHQPTDPARTRSYFAGTPYPGGGITAIDYHQAVFVVVTELERITADPDGAAGKVWRRLGRDEWQTLTEALDNPDGDRLYVVQAEQARKRQKEREAAAREARRPVCGSCGATFTEDRWDSIRHHPAQQHRDLCEPCLHEH